MEAQKIISIIDYVLFSSYGLLNSIAYGSIALSNKFQNKSGSSEELIAIESTINWSIIEYNFCDSYINLNSSHKYN